MADRALTTLICAGLGAGLCACSTMNSAGGAVAAGGGAVYNGGVTVYRTSSSVVGTTMGETYNGIGGAARRPFQDFNLMQDKVPDSLERSLKNPYDTTGLTSCDKINEQVAALDVALGPDLDTPKVEGQRDMWQRGASSAADAALAAASGAADHFIPVRGVIRQLSGATRTEKHAKKAELAGSVRRGFLKAVGMQQGCGWPAAPVDFRPPEVVQDRAFRHADVAALTTKASAAGPSAAKPQGGPAATPGPAAGVQAVSIQTVASGGGPTSAVQALATPASQPQDYARALTAEAPAQVATVRPAPAQPASLQSPPVQAQAIARPARAASPPPAGTDPSVQLADRAPTQRRPVRRGGGAIERAPVGQSVVLPPRAG